MKKLNYFLVAALAVVCIACGGNKNSNSSDSIQSGEEKVDGIVPESVTVSGELGPGYKVVDRVYNYEDGMMGKEITVELERTDAELPFDPDDNVENFDEYSYKNPCVLVGFGIEVLDANGNILDKKAATSLPYSRSDIKDIAKLKPGERGSIKFSLYNDNGDKARKFRISSAFEDKGGAKGGGKTAASSSSNSDGNYIGSSGSVDYDKMLDAYEEYIDEYVAYYKKVKNGDTSASSQIGSLMKKAEEFGNTLSKAKGEMSTAQWDRYLSLMKKKVNLMKN